MNEDDVTNTQRLENSEARLSMVFINVKVKLMQVSTAGTYMTEVNKSASTKKKYFC
jgi:hypothetical protein